LDATGIQKIDGGRREEKNKKRKRNEGDWTQQLQAGEDQVGEGGRSGSFSSRCTWASAYETHRVEMIGKVQTTS